MPDPTFAYDERTARLRASGIALWDVCEAAVRPGSLDASIDLQTVVTNDFALFFQQHPGIVHVCANGATAHRLYLRRVRPLLPEPSASLPLHLLPSTSPAHASLRPAQKLARWRVLDELRASRSGFLTDCRCIDPARE